MFSASQYVKRSMRRAFSVFRNFRHVVFTEDLCSSLKQSLLYELFLVQLEAKRNLHNIFRLARSIYILIEILGLQTLMPGSTRITAVCSLFHAFLRCYCCRSGQMKQVSGRLLSLQVQS